MSSPIGDPTPDTGEDPAAALDATDRAAVHRMRTVAWALDDAVRIPGTNRRIGIDPIVGVLPVGGDLVTAAASMYIVAQSALLGVGRWTLVRMLANIAVDAGAGSVPVLGDIFDAAWKANERNVALAVADLATDDESADDGSDPISVAVDAETTDADRSGAGE